MWSRAEEAAASHHWRRLHERSWVHVLWSGMAWTGTAFRVASLANFLVFLRHGMYRCCSRPSPLWCAPWVPPHAVQAGFAEKARGSSSTHDSHHGPQVSSLGCWTAIVMIVTGKCESRNLVDSVWSECTKFWTSGQAGAV